MASKMASLASVAMVKGLKNEESVHLDRPLLAVPGFMGQISDTAHLTGHLSAAGDNGDRVYYCKDNQLFRDAQFQQPVPSGWTDPKARVFQLVPHDPAQNPEITAGQIGSALKQIAEVTGQSKVDVVAHSMGGIATRIWITGGGSDIGKFMMVGTPNQGTRAATLAEWAVNEGVGWAMKLGGVGPAALGALSWLRASADGNPKLDKLNARWTQDKLNLEDAMVVGAGGRLTANSSASGWGDGDGLVNSAALSLPETPTRLLPGTWTQGHKALMHDRQVFAEMRSFFGWTKTTS